MINLFDSNPINGHSFMNDLKKEFYKREMKQTAIQLLKESIDYEMKLGTKMVVNWDMYLEMEKEQIEEAFLDGYKSHPYLAEQYYKETYGEE